MYGIILCAGLGKRLFPITKYYAKPAIRIMEKSVVEYSLDALLLAGINKVIITTYHNAQTIYNLDLSAKYHKCNISVIQESKLLGTGGGLRNALILGGLDNNVVTVNGDTLWTIDLNEAIKYHISNNHYVSLILGKADNEMTPIFVDDKMVICGIGGLTNNETAYKIRTFIGISILGIESQRNIINHENCEYYIDDIIRPIMKSRCVKGIEGKGFWADLGTPSKYIAAALEIGKIRGQPARYVIGNNCRLGSAVKVLDSIIWDNVIIGNESTISNSILLNDVIIANNTVVENSVVIPHHLDPGLSEENLFTKDQVGNWYYEFKSNSCIR